MKVCSDCQKRLLDTARKSERLKIFICRDCSNKRRREISAAVILSRREIKRVSTKLKPKTSILHLSTIIFKNRELLKAKLELTEEEKRKNLENLYNYYSPKSYNV